MKTLDKLDNFLNTPGGGFLMNLLAQSGYSTMPQSPMGAIGKAALMTQQQQRQSGMNDLQRRFIESQIGLNDARARSPFGLGNAPKPPASIAEYNLYKEQTEASGGTPVPFESWVKDLAKLRASGAAEGKESVTTPAQGAVDSSYGTEYVGWTSGGQADALKGLSQLREARLRLDSENVSGPLIGMAPDALLKRANPRAADTKALIEEVVQRNLRLILGAQFTEKEGERLISRAYDVGLDEELNKGRLDRLIRQIELGIEAKNDQARYYQQNGTLKGWQGRIPTLADFNEAIGDAEAPESAAGRPDDIEPEVWAEMTPEQRALFK